MMVRLGTVFVLSIAAVFGAVACSGSDKSAETLATGGTGSGGLASLGGTSMGSAGTGGKPTSVGGVTNTGGQAPLATGGSTPSGGAVSNTGGAPTGGQPAGGTSATGGNGSGGRQTGRTTAGGAATGGRASGGNAVGGSAASGAASGGQATGGNATGGVGSGGKSAGGTDATGGVGSGGKSTGGTNAAGGTGSAGKNTGGTNASGGSSGGEPPHQTVRVFWLRPSDVPDDTAHPEGIAKVMAEAQSYYKKELGKTFKLNTPVVETVLGEHVRSWYENTANGGDKYWWAVFNMQQELMRRFSLKDGDSRWVLVGEVSAEGDGAGGGGGNGWVILCQHDADGAAGIGATMDRWYGGMVHELGHAFGLPDSTSTDGTPMSGSFYSYPNCHFTDSQKKGILNGPYGSFFF